ncbi:hypothetical protein HELRODRAFT_90526, partial [Helobdella robusta]|uniref:Calponin-homology (CH) domain-containing protein n=1 Tax=Helobdella robusta TaxID=6412 RepID=T1G7S7_HELRO
LESKLKITLPPGLDGCLKDGVVLCHFVNELFPGTISLVYVPRTENVVLSVARCRSNVDFFINACHRLGLEKVCLFVCLFACSFVCLII